MADKTPNKPSHDDDTHSDAQVTTKPKVKTARPSMYKVILLNDDFTPMDFVIVVLKKFFLKSDEDAHRIMMQVHNHGAAIAGVYPYDVAETKVYAVHEFSRRHKYPLKCIMEKDLERE